MKERYGLATVELHYLNKTKQYNSKGIIKYVYKYLISGIIMLVSILLFEKYISTLLGILFAVAIGAIIYFAILIILRDDLLLNEVKKLKKKLVGGLK